MSAYDRLVELLPSLWRPQDGDRTLVAQWLRSVGGVFDQTAAQAQHVLRAHWSDTADAALWSAHHQADRRERGLAPVNVRKPADFAELQRYPYIGDAARLAALLELPPWRDPASLREKVEEYRQRVQDVVAAYTAGLVTVAALRRLVDAALPEDMAAPPAQRRGGYAIEEPVALRRRSAALLVPQAQEGDLVAPLSSWSLPEVVGVPGFVLQGAPGGALEPAIERVTPTAQPLGIALGWLGTLADGEALRFAPTRRSWLLADGALSVSPGDRDEAVDPGANGPWTALPALPAGKARALVPGPDGVLWLIVQDGATWSVQRYDGSGFATIAVDAPAGPLHALQVAGERLFLAAEQGLFSTPLWPEAGAARWTGIAEVTGVVRALAPLPEGFAAAGSDGLWRCAGDGSVLEHSLAALDLHAVAVFGEQGYVATASALFLYQHQQAFRYDGTGLSETVADWLPVAAPDDTMDSPLPAVHALARTRDGSLWIASADGLARWRVRDAGTTLLEAYPDVLRGPVHALHVDERGMLWIAAEAGLFRYDGAAVAQSDLAAGRWNGLGAADAIFPDEIAAAPRGHWRYEAGTGTWLQWTGARFADPQLAPRAAPAAPVHAACVLPAVRAERGSWDGSAFTASAPVPDSELVVRVKTSLTRIVDGGAPFLPANVPGARWRYLQLDRAPEPPAAGRPWWSREGQLFPPPERGAPWPGHFRSGDGFHDDGHFDDAVFVYPPSARLWIIHACAPDVGVRIRLFAADPAQALEPALTERVWALVQRARAAGVPLQLMVEGRLIKESTS